MNILKALFGNSEETPEEEKKNADARKFDLMKYDGVKAMKIGRFDYAVKCFEEALQLHDDLEVRDYLSRSLVQQGQYDEALQQLALLIEAQPHNVSLPMQAAHVAFQKEDYDKMQAFCEHRQAECEDTLHLRPCLFRQERCHHGHCPPHPKHHPR